MTLIRELPNPPAYYVQKCVTVRVAAQILGVTPFTVARLCREGLFKSAYKPGTGVNGHWRILRSEVIARTRNCYV